MSRTLKTHRASSIIRSFLLLTVLLFSGCLPHQEKSAKQVVEPNFSFRYDRGSGATLMRLDASIDTIRLDAFFETGCPGLVLDNSIAKQLPYLDSVRLAGGMTVEDVSFSYSGRSRRWKLYHKDIDVIIDSTIVNYDKFFVADIKRDYGMDALIPIPEPDRHTWSIDFENCRIGLSENLESVIPDEYDLATDIYFDTDKLCIKNFPFVFSGLSTKFDMIIDTGTYGISMAIISAPDNYSEIRSFLESNSILSYEEITSTKTHHIIDSGIIKDTLVVSEVISEDQYKEVLAGLGLLSRFNIILDMNARKAYFKRNAVEKDFYEYVQDHGAIYSGITMIPFKNDLAAVAIDVGREMPSYKAGLRNYDIVTHLGEKQFSDKYASRYFYDNRDTIMTLGIERYGKKMEFSFKWDLPTNNSDTN